MSSTLIVLLYSLVIVKMVGKVGGDQGVTYDGRSLIINGTSRILFSGSIHYPRSTPQMWQSLISKAKEGGLDVIQTYVFWNMHEPVQGQFDFKGRHNLVGFIKEIEKQGLYVNLRIGPFIEAEWKYGGLPLWLHDIPGIVFRSDNEPFKFHMQKFVSMIVNMMKSEGLYASQGGPIILSQIENEYSPVEAAFHEKGPPYVLWAASMAVGLQTGVPWIMCKQDDAPDPVINTCNGLKCGLTFKPNSPTKPAIWTENWTMVFTKVGEEPRLRSAEDIAFHVALFIAKQGSFVNYYMYHGGTNFGRTASAYTTTSYYDYAPLDEYGLIRQPKWGHLKHLHEAIKSLEEQLLLGRYKSFTLGLFQEAHVFQEAAGSCAAFLVNYDERNNAIVNFWNNTYELPRKSISILSNCKNVIFNTAKVNVGDSIRSATAVQLFNDDQRWQSFRDRLPNITKPPFTARFLLEQMKTTKDFSDYLWYCTRYNHISGTTQQVLHVESRGHIVHAFVNGMLVGRAHGNYSIQGVVLDIPITLMSGLNNISLLSVMAGLPDSGAFMERRQAGINRVKLVGSSVPIDLKNSVWGYQVGLFGEKKNIYTEEGSENVNWGTITNNINQPLIWYKTVFDAPPGTNPVALNLLCMGKGEVWINGHSIGRYWVSFKTPKGQPAQSLYHIPRSFIKPSQNLLVLLEEEGGDPLLTSLVTISVGAVDIFAVARRLEHTTEPTQTSLLSDKEQTEVHLQCFEGKTIASIEFKDDGDIAGDRQNYAIKSCHAEAAKTVFEKFCLGRADCSIPLSALKFNDSPCTGTQENLLLGASCS